MSIKINSNIASMGALRSLDRTTSELQRSFERLASGLRINRASDDAAGLAISSALNVDKRVFVQAVRNLNDGVSAIAIADGALENLGSIVTRLRELAEKSANDTLTYQQRRPLAEEADALVEEYNRIIRSTEFNGKNLLTAGSAHIDLQAGYGDSGKLAAALGGISGDGTFGAAISSSVGAINGPRGFVSGDFNLDGKIDIITTNITSGGFITTLLGNGDGTFQDPLTFDGNPGTQVYQVTRGDYNNDGYLDVATVDSTNGTLGVYLGNGDGTFQTVDLYNVGQLNTRDIETADVNGDGHEDLLVSSASNHTVTTYLGDGSGQFESMGTTSVSTGPFELAVADFNGDGFADIATSGTSGGGGLAINFGNGNGTFASATTIVSGTVYQGIDVGDIDNDGDIDIAVAASSAGEVHIYRGAGNGSFSQSASFSIGSSLSFLSLDDFDSDGFLDVATSRITTGSATLGVSLGNGDGTFQVLNETKPTGGEAPATVGGVDVNADGVLDLLSPTSFGALTVFLGNTRNGTAQIEGVDLSHRYKALEAMEYLSQLHERLILQRGVLGASESRVQAALNVLPIAAENLAAAESRIADIDVATESSKLIRLNLLQQASRAILAQANLQPQLALSLLG